MSRDSRLLAGGSARVLRGLGWLGVVVAQLAVLQAYASRGTTWHWLLHLGIGTGLGLAVAGAASTLLPGRDVPRPLLPVLAGQAVSLGPDLIFRFGQLPHRPWMDAFVGHVSVHTGPAPLVVATATTVTGGLAWHAAAAGRSRRALAAAATTVGVLALALLLAEPLPTTLAGYADR